jgi:hypothetical protein
MGTYEYDKAVSRFFGDLKNEPHPEFTIIDVTIDFSGNSNDWNATISFKDGIPFSLSYYIWSASEENVEKGLLEMIGPNYKIINHGGGNGHYYADIVAKVSTEQQL